MMPEPVKADDDLVKRVAEVSWRVQQLAGEDAWEHRLRVAREVLDAAAPRVMAERDEAREEVERLRSIVADLLEAAETGSRQSTAMPDHLWSSPTFLKASLVFLVGFTGAWFMPLEWLSWL